MVRVLVWGFHQFVLQVVLLAVGYRKQSTSLCIALALDMPKQLVLQLFCIEFFHWISWSSDWRWECDWPKCELLFVRWVQADKEVM